MEYLSRHIVVDLGYNFVKYDASLGITQRPGPVGKLAIRLATQEESNFQQTTLGALARKIVAQGTTR